MPIKMVVIHNKKEMTHNVFCHNLHHGVSSSFASFRHIRKKDTNKNIEMFSQFFPYSDTGAIKSKMHIALYSLLFLFFFSWIPLRKPLSLGKCAI